MSEPMRGSQGGERPSMGGGNLRPQDSATSPHDPLLRQRGHRYEDKYGRKRGVWEVGVYPCPADSSKYSFAYSDSGGICVFDEFKGGINIYLSGRFDTPQQALEAGLKLGIEERSGRRQ